MIPLVFLTPSERRNRAGAIPISQNGPVRTVAFDDGEAWLLEENTTNLVARTQNQLPATTIASSNETFVRTIVSDEVCRVERVAMGNWLYVGTVPEIYTASAGDVWTQSVDVRGDSINWAHPTLVQAQLWGKLTPESSRLEHSTNKEIVSIEELEDGWRRITARSEWSADCISAGGRILGDSLTTQVGQTIEVRRPQIEIKPYATTYARGDMGSGYSWAGAVNNSASIRAQSTLRLPAGLTPWFQNGDAYGVYARFSVENFPDVSNAHLISAGHGSPDWPRLFAIATTSAGGVRAMPRGNAAGAVTAVGPFAPGSHFSVYAGREAGFGSIFKMYMNGEPKGSSTHASITEWTTPHGFGVRSSGSASTKVAAIVLFNHTLTEAEIARLDTISTADFTWDNVVQPEVRAKINGEIVRAVGHKVKHHNALQDIWVGR